MLATPLALPVGRNWAYQAKLDGIRLITTLARGSLRLSSRNEKDLTAAFPELQLLQAALTEAGVDQIMLDGELVAAGPGTVPSLGQIATRVHRRRATPRDMAAVPVTYVIFDLLQLNGASTMSLPYDERQTLLRATLPAGPHWTVAEDFDDGAGLWEATRQQGLEGVVAKKRTSPYTPGVRSRNWVKAVHRSDTDAVVYGWRPESGGRSRIGSLMVAVHSAEGLIAAGRVGSGMTQELSDALSPVLQSIEVDAAPIPPLEPEQDTTRWCEPIIVVSVRHLGRTEDGALRHPVLTGVRADLNADDLEPP